MSELFLKSIISALIPAAATAQDGFCESDCVIFRVNGVGVFRSQVTVSDHYIAKVFAHRFGREVERPRDDAELNAVRNEVEASRGVDAARHIVREQQRARLGAIPSEIEIKRKAAEMESEFGSVANVTADARNEARLRLEACTEVLINGRDAEEVHKQLLSSTMSLESWQSMWQHVCTPDGLRAMRWDLERCDEELVDYLEMARVALQQTQLDAAVREELSKD